MSAGIGKRWRRRVTDGLGAHIEAVMPRRRREWARAMAREIENIDHFPSAIAFAVGCLFSAYQERMFAMDRMMMVRLGAAAYAALWGVMKIGFATLALAPSGLSGLPGWFGEGGLAGLNAAAQAWQLAAFYISGAAFLAAALAFARWRPSRLAAAIAVAFSANAATAAGLSAATYLAPGAAPLWSFGIVVEEFTALTALLFAAFFVWRGAQDLLARG